MAHRRSAYTSIEHVDEDEKKLLEAAKHPFGIMLLYIQAAIGLVFALGLAYFLIPSVLEDNELAFGIANVFAAMSILLTTGVLLVSSIVYRQNRLIVTDRNITQILQYGLFNRKVSQLNLVNVEDVTSQQDGIFATFFNYGTIKIETAGEQENFHFTYCPYAGKCAKIILDAREKMLGQQDGDSRVKPGVHTTR